VRVLQLRALRGHVPQVALQRGSQLLLLPHGRLEHLRTQALGLGAVGVGGFRQLGLQRGEVN